MPPTTPTGLTFDETRHAYTLDGRRVPGVTSIIGVLDKSGPLTRWAARTVAEYVWDNPDETTRLLAGDREQCVRALTAIPDAIRDTAADRGSTIHTHAEAILRDHAADVADVLVPVVQGVVRFLEEWEVDPILTEYACASREHRWAGTGDTIAHYRHPNTGHRGVLYADWKSGKNTYGESGLQFAAYVNAEFWGLDGDERPIPEVDAVYGVHTLPGEAVVYPYEHGPAVYADFLTCRAAYEIKLKANRKPGPSAYKRPAVTTEKENQHV